MPTWIEPPPKQRKTGCLGKGCMMLIVFLILLAVAFFVGGYVGVRYDVASPDPEEITHVQSSEAEAGAVRHRREELNVCAGRAADMPALLSIRGDGAAALTT